MDNQTAKESCLRYFEGVSDFATEQEVRNYILSKNGDLTEFRSWEKEWASYHTPTIPQINSFNRLRAKIAARRRRRIFMWMASAAAVAAMLPGLFLWLKPQEQQLIEPKVYIVETGYQERTKVVLPDSTQVWLNSATRLSYTDDFMTNNRQVEISGEAFFDVTSHETLPFVVKFGDNTVTVKGTKFNITAYDVEDKVYTALLEGRIEFAGNDVKLDMRPGELLSYDMKSKDMLKCTTDLSSHVSWVSGKLDYSSITLKQLLTRLSSIYGFELHYKPVKYADHSFRIILSTNESLTDVLDAVSIIVPVRWSYENGVVSVTEK